MSSQIFYPNDCIVCRKRTSLKRCSRCHMISYCEEKHQMEHWQKHKELCHVISKITKKNNISHLYENLRGSTLIEWTKARIEMIQRITCALGRDLRNDELQMLQYPRCCFVCYDTRQNNLKNCPRCPLVSFCQKHPQSDLHNEICSDIINCYDFEIDEHTLIDAAGLIVCESTVFFPKIFKKLPKSTTEYLNAATKVKMNDKLIRVASMMVYDPLTIFGALQKLNSPPTSKLIVHVYRSDDINLVEQFWEILLHLMDNLQNLTIVLTECTTTKIVDLGLCKRCTHRKRKIIFEHYKSMEKFDLKTINLAFFNNISPLINEINFHHQESPELSDISVKFTCPVVLTSSIKFSKQFQSKFENVCSNMSIIYEGENDFSSLLYRRDWVYFQIVRVSQFMLIAKPSVISKPIGIKMTKMEEKVSKCDGERRMEENTKDKKIQRIQQFYAGICHVCKTSNATVTCTRCKMIFYCCNNHMKMNNLEHKEICRVILGMLSEKGTPHLYDKLPIINEKTWLEAKVKFIKQAKLKLNRNLLDFEKQMFLFPRTCFVCHESDLSVLKTCKCSVSLCKIHRDNIEHKNLCEHFQMNLNLQRNKKHLEEELTVSGRMIKNRQQLPSTMNQFLDLHFNFPIEKNLQKILLSDFLSRPLTIIHIIEKLKIKISYSFIIHIVGATDEEIVDYWNILLYWFKNLEYLYIDFIGLEISKVGGLNDKERNGFFYSSELGDREMSFNSAKKRYDEFWENGGIFTPDLIIGYNLNLNENNLEIANNSTWKETLKFISQMNVPFVITAMTEERAKKDHEFFCSILGKEINYEFMEKNPYCSLMPERNYETERICYSNSHVIAYKKYNGPKIGKKIESLGATNCESKCSTSNANIINNNNKKKKKKDNAEKCDNKNVKDSKVDNGELLRENEKLQQENKILQENLRLKEENERLKNEILKMSLKDQKEKK